MIINVYDMIDDVVIMKFFVFCSTWTFSAKPRIFVWNVVVDPLAQQLSTALSSQLDEIDEWFFLYNRQLDREAKLFVRRCVVDSRDVLW